MRDRSSAVATNASYAESSTHGTPARTPVLPVADRLATVLADADMRHRNPAAAQMIATTTVAQAWRRQW